MPGRSPDGGRLWIRSAALDDPHGRSALQNGYGQLRRLAETEAALHPEALTEIDGRLVLMLSGPAAQPLPLAAPVSGDVGAFLDRAVAICRAVQRMHAAGVVHRGLHPDALWLSDDGGVRLSGFDDATTLQGGAAPNLLPAHLAYMAPEQTGRMNRGVDARADLYALGVILFTQLTGSLPLLAEHTAGWVHAHLAQRPDFSSGPPVLGLMVDQLLSKAPSARYQSAAGLLSDLRAAQAAWRADGTLADFNPAHRTTSDRFALPQRLFGRADDHAALKGTLAAAADGAPRISLVAGVAGIGKSRLILELQPAVTARGGFYAAGKATRYERDRPYGVLVDALEQLVDRALARPQALLDRWRARFEAALGPNGQVILDLLPRAKHLTGPQPPAPTLQPEQTRLRLRRALAAFIAVIAQPAHPVVLVLDDLQWVDDATLELVEALLAADGVLALHLVGSYRSEEVTATHPLRRFIERLEGHGTHIETCRLGPLPVDAIAELVAATVGAEPAESAGLASVIAAKTAANPFFVARFLTTLHDDGLLTFDAPSNRWRWDLGRIARAAISDNVVELMAAHIRRLPDDARQTLVDAAVVGGRFELGTVAALRDLTPEAALHRLAPALAAELVRPLGDAARRPEVADVDARYGFAHDRVHEAARSLMPDADRGALHAQIARQQREALALDDADALFEVVDHFTRGAEHLTDTTERDEVADLHRRAGARAWASGAHDAALRCYEAGVALLDEAAWSRCYPTALALHEGLADAARIAGDAARAHAQCDTVEAHARSPLDTVRVQAVLTYLLSNESRLAEAVHGIVALVARLGHPINPPAGAEALMARVTELVTHIATQGPEAIATLPDAEDPSVIAALGVLGSSLPTAAMGLPAMHPVLVLHAVQLTLSNGVAVGSGAAISHLGLILAAVGQFGPAFLLGTVSERLRRRVVPEGTTEGLIEFLVFIHHWSAPLRDTIALTVASEQRSLELGDPVVYGYCVNQHYMASVLVGDSLDRLDAAYAERLESLMGYSQDLAASSVRIWGQAVTCLRDPEGVSLLVGERFDASHLTPESPSILRAYMATAQALVGLLRGQPAQALAAVDAQVDALQHPAVAPAIMTPAVVAWRALAATAVALDAPHSARGPLEVEARAGLERLRGFSASCEANHAHRIALLEAELAWLEGDLLAAMDAYDRAAAVAQTNAYRHEEGYARERAAVFHAAHGRPLVARSYAREARRLYAAWGAHAVVRRLDATWPDLGQPTDSGGRIHDQLDLEAVLDASRAFAETLELAPLLERVMTILRHNAGAQRAVFALDRGGVLCVEAVDDEAGTEVLQSTPAHEFPALPTDIVGYVGRTHEPVVLIDARADERFGASPDVVVRGVRSVLCVPLLHQGNRLGVLYLENTLASGVFTAQRAALVQAISAQAAIALKHAILLAEARQAAAELERQNVRLTEVDRMRDEFLARTSHELRTPINGIIGLAESALSGAVGPVAPAQAQNLQMIAVSGRRLSNLVNDILDFSSLREGQLVLHPAPMHLADVLQRVFGILQSLVERKGLAMLDQIPPDLARVHADANRVEQVLLNLVGNAVKFTASGHVAVSAALTDGGRVRVAVTDTGPGIAQAVQAQIFKPFDMGGQAVDRGQTGTGLGLSVARQLVELHGGELSVESTPGEGATFWFTLPLATDVDQLVSASPRRPVRATLDTVEIHPVAGHPRSGDGLRILVVDDEPINLQVVRQHLEPAGFTVHTCLGGLEALERLDGDLRPDLVLLDVMMPELDGFTTCQRVRERFPANELPVVMLTAKDQDTDLVRGLEAGANDYITKPFSARELLARLHTHLKLARIHHAVGRFVPHTFVNMLGRESIADVNLGDTVAERMTVLFADIHGFGALAERLNPESSFRFINEYLGVLEPVVMRHGGFVDKYMGDKVMAVFPGDPGRAIDAGLALQDAVHAYNTDTRRPRGLPPLQVGVGINSGELMLGTVGSEGRMDTTVISDAVNLASRLQKRTRELAARVLVGHATFRQAARSGDYHARLVEVSEGAQVYEIYDADPPGAIAAKDATREMFEQAVRAYHEHSFGDARRLFAVCAALDPSDPAVRYYVDRCEQLSRLLGGQAIR